MPRWSLYSRKKWQNLSNSTSHPGVYGHVGAARPTPIGCPPISSSGHSELDNKRTLDTKDTWIDDVWATHTYAKFGAR